MREDLIAAYRGTSYRVVGPHGGIAAEARIGLASTAIDAVLEAHGAGCGVFVTAWNPKSVAQERAVNDAAHGRLVSELEARGDRFLPHVGMGTDPGWAEHGLFVLDLGTADALALAAAYGQHAVVAIARGRQARLLLTELMTG